MRLERLVARMSGLKKCGRKSCDYEVALIVLYLIVYLLLLVL
jgi:hypothetical protein